MQPSPLSINTVFWTILIVIFISCQQNAATSTTSTLNNSYSYNTASHIFESASSIDKYANGDIYNIWTDLSEAIKYVIKKCATASSTVKQNNTGSSSERILEDCLKRKSLLAIDRALNRDAISIGNGAIVFKWKNAKGEDGARYLSNKIRSNSSDWGENIKSKILQFFNTRELKIRLNNFHFMETADERMDNSEGRGRRKGNMMAQLLMFALVAAGIIVIPMGFQFLAVLGGKALLLAKLALLLTSIQGLKKIATSQFNYGLYSHGGGGGPCLLFLPIDLCETYRYLQEGNLFLPPDPNNANFDPYYNNIDLEHFGDGPYKFEPHFEHPELIVKNHGPVLNYGDVENYGPVEIDESIKYRNQAILLHHTDLETVKNIDPIILNKELQTTQQHHDHIENSEVSSSYLDYNFDELPQLQEQE